MTLEKDDWRLVVVADGHGSKPHGRSEVGSRLACQCTKDVVEQFIEESSTESEEFFKSFKSFWEQEAFGKIHDLWNRKVNEDIRDCIKNNEPDFSDSKEINFSVGKLGHRIKYGTTLLCVLSFGNSIALGQVGDGLIAVTGEQVNFPLAGSKEELDNTRSETDSLCNPDPRPVFRAFKAAKPPRLVIACTDGIDDAFESIEHLENWALNYSAQEQVNEPDFVEETIGSFLRQCSEASGDDSTLGLVYNSEGARPEIHEEVEAAGNQEENKTDAESAESAKDVSDSESSDEKNVVPLDPVLPEPVPISETGSQSDGRSSPKSQQGNEQAGSAMESQDEADEKKGSLGAEE